MRGSDERTGALFSYVDLESRVRKDHPLRTIRRLVNEALSALEGEFSSIYSGMGRPTKSPWRFSISPCPIKQGFLDVRYGARDGAACAEFSWQGYDDNDPACGRGWVMIGTAGRLVGHFFIHKADHSGFVCEPD